MDIAWRLASSSRGRVAAVAVLIVAWLIVGSIGGPIFGKLSTVASNDQASFLPDNADSTKVQNLLPNFESSTVLPAVIIGESSHTLTPSDMAAYAQMAQRLRGVSAVADNPTAVIGPIPSTDRKAVEIIAQLQTKRKLQNAVADVSTVVAAATPTGSKAYVTGPAGLIAALFGAFSGIDGTLLYVTLSAVFIILLLVYRSLILPFLVLLTAGFALSAAGFTVFHGVGSGWFKLNGQGQGILSILAIGATTDYSLLLISRYREALTTYASKWHAMRVALTASFEPIVASGATVILGLLCLLFSDLNSNKSLGPVAALGIVFALLSALSFLPAVLLIFGRTAFWPRRPKFDPASHSQTLVTGLEDRRGLWRRIPEFVRGHARPIWIVCLVLLVGCALAMPSFRASGVSDAATILGDSAAVNGQNALERHFPSGSGSPMLIIADEAQAKTVLRSVSANAAVSSAQVVGTANPLTGQTVPTIVHNRVLITATLKIPADSAAAEHIVTQLRTELPKADPGILIGGATAISLDSNNTGTADLHKIIPIVLVVVFVVLALLLRSLVAPALLIGSVILSFSATLGISALLFNNVLGFPGSDAAIPLFGFIFLVALGVDYNIFLMTRVREESIKHNTKFGVLRGLSVTGGVITSAGIVLATTFAALAVIPILFLIQIAFIVAFGVLLDAVIVRSLLVPALSYDIGRGIWWPSRLSKRQG